MVEKIQEFLFDIIGLLIPGLVIVILILAIPISMLPIEDLSKIVDNDNQIIRNIVNFYQDNKIIFYILVLCGGYIIGHAVKVFSKITYEFLTVVFNDGIFKFVKWIFDQSTSKSNHFSELKEEYKNRDAFSKNHAILTFTIKVMNFLVKHLKVVFSFQEDNYDAKNKSLIDDSINRFNKLHNTNFPKEWYSIYKLGNITISQAGIKTLANNFLAKYNFYRSMSFIFLVNFLYLPICFHNHYGNYFSILLIANILLWITFHDKYKRYWKLCGNETLVNFYYYMITKENKKEDTVNEG